MNDYPFEKVETLCVLTFDGDGTPEDTARAIDAVNDALRRFPWIDGVRLHTVEVTR